MCAFENIKIPHSGLFSLRILQILILRFRCFWNVSRTSDFSKITTSQKHYKTSLKCTNSMHLRCRKRQNCAFRSEILAISDFRKSSPNRSGARKLSSSGRRCVQLLCVHRPKRFASGRRCVRHVCDKIQLPRRNWRSRGRSDAASCHQRRVKPKPATS